MPFCSNCGKQLAEDARFCGFCGTPVEIIPEPEPEPVPEPMPEPAPEPVVEPVSEPDTEPVVDPEPEADTFEPAIPDFTPEETDIPYTPEPTEQYTYNNNYDYSGYQPAQAASPEPEKKSVSKGAIAGIAVGAIVIIAAVAYLLFAIFSGGKASSKYVGYWECSTLEIEDSGEVESYYGIDVSSIYTMTLNKDGTFEFYSYGTTIDGTWTSSKSVITLDAGDNDTIDLAYDDGIITMDLSDEDGAFIIKFERVSEDTASNNTTVDEDEDADADDGEESIAEDKSITASSDEDETLGESGALGDYYVEILGGQPTKDYLDNSCYRVYYRFTNNSDEPISALMSIDIDAYQSGVELDYTYADDYIEVDDYYFLDVMPGTSIVCTEIFELEDDSDITVEFTSYPYDGTVSRVFSCDEDDGDIDYTIKTADVSDWVNGLSDGAEWETFSCYIDSASFASSYDGENDLIRVYFEYTNNTNDEDTFYSVAYVYAFQDNVELFTGYPKSEEDSDSQIYYDVDAGDSAIVSECFELRSDSPVVVVVYDYDSEEYIACTFNF
jgi:hypothetical protein